MLPNRDEPSYINQLCPKCNRAMVSLTGYVAEGSCDEDETDTSSMWGAGGSEFSLFNQLFDGATYAFRRWRLRPLAIQYPASLYCTRCGYVKRRT
ncbi:MAG: hypothetical protein M3Y56_15085 [Armatimonadota bacterium]|nr:hypothetical protein [Armatimonadota bacterium]